MNPRQGLKRHGMRTYIVQGRFGDFLIERERPWRFSLRRADMPPGFYMEKFRYLGDAREVAEAYAGVKCEKPRTNLRPSSSKRRPKSKKPIRQNRRSSEP